MIEDQDSSDISKISVNSNLDVNKKSEKLTLHESEQEEAFRFIKTISEFSEIPSKELKVLTEHSYFSNINAGEYISNEGEQEGANGYIIASGCLAMLKSSINGKELIVELLQGNDIFGMLLMLAADKLPYQLSARAIKKSRVLWIPINAFNHLLKSHPILFKEFVAHLLICLQSSYKLSRGLAHDRVEVRIAAILASLALKFSKHTSQQELAVINFTRQQLSDLTGTTPETAIRVTRAMQAEGLIDISHPGVIRILDQKALNDLAES